MNQRRIQDFYNPMVKAVHYEPGEVDMLKVATLPYVDRRVGQDLKTQLSKCH